MKTIKTIVFLLLATATMHNAQAAERRLAATEAVALIATIGAVVYGMLHGRRLAIKSIEQMTAKFEAAAAQEIAKIEAEIRELKAETAAALAEAAALQAADALAAEAYSARRMGSRIAAQDNKLRIDAPI